MIWGVDWTDSLREWTMIPQTHCRSPWDRY